MEKKEDNIFVELNITEEKAKEIYEIVKVNLNKFTFVSKTLLYVTNYNFTENEKVFYAYTVGYIIGKSRGFKW